MTLRQMVNSSSPVSTASCFVGCAASNHTHSQSSLTLRGKLFPAPRKDLPPMGNTRKIDECSPIQRGNPDQGLASRVVACNAELFQANLPVMSLEPRPSSIFFSHFRLGLPLRLPCPEFSS